MRNKTANPERDGWSEMEPHDGFIELCAISTSGELTEEEQKTLQRHLVACPECRQALKEFEAAAGIGMPLLHPQLSNTGAPEPTSIPAEAARAAAAHATGQTETPHQEQQPTESTSELRFPHRNGDRHMQVNWNYVWMPFAAAVVLSAALAIYSFQVGKHKGQDVVRATPTTPDAKVDALEKRISDAGHDREILRSELVERNRVIAQLQRQVENQSADLNETKSARTNLEQSLLGDRAERQQVVQEQSNLLQQLDFVQSSLRKTQAELDSLRQQRSQDQSRAESLEAQIRDLHGQLREQELAVSKQEELLAHDRDIRELMGARELYIAEVYDVARDGQTQKPYGRVFYTKGKSLIFYAYDLDQQAGLQRASTFQAWGSRGVDKQQATSLGVFFEDSLAKKRWVLKFDDPKKLEQIDAVFVTVEPNGGSRKPSGKPLLFAYLKVDPNHP